MKSSARSPLTYNQLLDHLQIIGSDLSSAVVLYHQAAAERFGLNATDMKTIPLLHSPTPQTAGDLARSLNLTTGAVTSVIDRLEKIGLVRRVADKTDRRKVLVKLVPKKLQEISQAYAPLAQAAKELQQTFTKEQLEIIIAYTEASITMMQTETIKLRQSR